MRGGAASRIAEEDDLLFFELQPGLAGAGGMVDECEGGQPASLDACYQRAHRLGESGCAFVCDHFASSDSVFWICSLQECLW